MSMTYFAIFYVAAIILFSVFVRLRLRKKRFLEEENKMGKNKPSSDCLLYTSDAADE